MNIVINGPESSGKTELVLWLSQYYKGTMISEYAREYLDKYGLNYTKKDLYKIKAEQQQQWQNVARKDGLFFFDTDLISTDIWISVIDNTMPGAFFTEIQAMTPDITLLLYPDLPWIYDPQRTSRYFRKELFKMHLAYLSKLKRKYVIISGTPKQRYSQSRFYINDLLK